MKKRFEKAERKQFAQQARGKDEWDREYDLGKQRKLKRRKADSNTGWGKTATVQKHSYSDQFQ